MLLSLGVDLFLVLLDQLVVLVLPLGGLGLLIDLQVHVIKVAIKDDKSDLFEQKGQVYLQESLGQCPSWRT